LVAATSTAAEKNSPPRYGIPKLAPGQFWVSSIPVGLEVVVGAEPGAKAVGRTPLVLDGKSLSREVTLRIDRKSFRGELPSQFDFLDFSAVRNHSVMILDHDGVKRDWARALTYRVDSPGQQTLIALFQLKTDTLSDFARRYPPGRNFSFQEKALRKKLERRGVAAADIDRGIRLLRRGGKVAVPGRGVWLIAEVQPSGDVTLIAGRR
jgi:hypothetical protein